MNDSSPGFEAELRVSPKPVIAALAVLGAGIILTINPLFDSSEQLRILLIGVLILVTTAVAWRFEGRKPLVGRWLTMILLVAMVYLSHIWLDVPGILTLMVIPTAMAAVLIGLSAATATAVGQTMLLLLLRVLANGRFGPAPFFVPGARPGTIAITLIAIWATFGVMYAVYNPVHRVARWSWDYFERAHGLLEEARDRKVELEQALDDLARANLQLTRLNTLAQGLRHAAEDARAAKEKFVANVSHELRTPLNMITGFSEMILQAPETYGSKIPSALLADLAVIHRNAEHLSDLIDDVLDLSQIEADQLALTKENVQFYEIIELATSAVRPLFDSKGLYLKTEVPEDLPFVFCDRTRIREVLLNLLSNAGRFTEQGGVRLRVRREGNDVVVAVADTGPGIATKDISRLFQPFQQADGSIRRRFGGTGLGLSISKRFIELHEGKIWVESEEGVGTTFSFRLPLVPPMPMGSGDFGRGIHPEWEFLQRTRPSMAPKAVVRPRFVVLETGDALQRLLTRYWDEVELVPVTSLEGALEELYRIPAQALLVNGASVAKSLEQFISATTLPGGTPAIVCSIPDVHQASAALDISDRLVKPISRDALLGALDRLGLEAGTVLIVDDEPDALQLFGRMLASSGRGHRVLLARDGREALNILHECRPDVILLDLVMPNMDGFQLLEMRSQDPALRDIPVVLISARDLTGQPIVSSALAVTQGGGLSVRQLLTSIEAISQVLSIAGQAGGPMPTGAPSG